MSTPLFADLFDAHRAKRVAEPRLIRSGVWSIPIPLSGSPLLASTIYAIETEEGLVLIDAAYNAPGCWTALNERLKAIGHRTESVRAVLLTHNHPDHVGLAEQIRQTSGATVVMDHDDDFAVQHETRGGFLTQLKRALDLSGAPQGVREEMFDAAIQIARHDESLTADRLLTGDVDIEFGGVVVRSIATPGHTWGHRVYAVHDTVFTGDTMMPEGPVQLAMPTHERDAPAHDLLTSLARIAEIGARIACPAHQYPYLDPALRARRLLAHHEGELSTVAEIVEPGTTAWDIAPRLTWSKPWEAMGTGSRRFSLMHTLANLQSVTAGHP